MKTFITKVYLDDDQLKKFNSIRECCRKTWNLGIAIQRNRWLNALDYLEPFQLDSFMRNSVKADFVKGCRSKIRQDLVYQLHLAYQRYFNGISGAPRFKSYRNPIKSIYLPKSKSTSIEVINSNIIKIPFFKKIKTHKKLPNEENFISGRLIIRPTKEIYLHLLIETPKPKVSKEYSEPLGIDMGIKKLVTFNRPIVDTSFTNGEAEVRAYPKLNDINKHIAHFENRIRRLDRAITKKVKVHNEIYKTEVIELAKQRSILDPVEFKRRVIRLWNKIYHSKNIDKLYAKRARAFEKITNIRRDYERKIIKSIVNDRPTYITIEDIDIRKMISESPSPNVTKAIVGARWRSFRDWLTLKCKEYDIPLRIADRKFKSSQICSRCGHTHPNLKIYNRTFKCSSCGNEIDRDINAAINLVKTSKYELA